MKRPGLAFAAALAVWLFGAPSASIAEEWTPPRMSYGDPDLQGTWTNATITGLERPDEIDELVLTAEQARRIEGGRDAMMRSIDDVPKGELEAGDDPGGYNTFWMDPGTRLAVVRGEIRSSLIVEPKDGQLPYSLRGRWAWLKRYWQFLHPDDPETRLLGERCIVGFGSTGGPPMLPVLYNNHYQIVQSPGFVLILVEMNHDARIIRLGGERLPPEISRWLGDSIGHFEGDTLVVETTNFHPGQSYRASIRHRVYISPDAVVTERFTRTGDKEILYEFTVDDPKIYRRPWRGEVPLLAAEGQIYEYACHEGNYAMTNILAGARAED